MEKFELASVHYRIWERIKKELSLLVLLVAILLFFVGINIVYLTATLVMYTLLLLLKRNRIITQIYFHHDRKEVELCYYTLIFIKSKEKIPYESLNYKMSLKRFGLGTATQTLELFKRKQLVGEIRKEGKWCWPESSIIQIHQILALVCKANESNKKE